MALAILAFGSAREKYKLMSPSRRSITVYYETRGRIHGDVAQSELSAHCASVRFERRIGEHS